MLRYLIYAIMAILLSAPATFASVRGYQTNQVYAGPYKSERVYQLDPQSEVYYPSSRFENLTEISCSRTRYALESRGQWVGNLSDQGACLGSVEAPEYAIGNYLNYKSGADDK